jgi:DNA-binding NarL/FixJ family response regulator
MIRIIIADNHQIIREGLKMILKAETDLLVMDEAQTGAQVLEKIQNSNCDILLLDMDMPGRNGFELINDVKKINPKLPILALSIHPEDKQALRILKSGASGYLCKDSASAELVIAIRKINTHGRYLSESLSEQLAFNIMDEKKAKPHEQLSTRELETLHLLVSGKKVKDIATELALSISTVFTYRGRIFEKLDINSNVELMHYAINNNLQNPSNWAL